MPSRQATERNLYEDLAPCSVLQNMSYLKWINSELVDRHHRKQPSISGNNKIAFKRAWGEQAFCYLGSVKSWVWRFYPTNTMDIYVSSSTRGTSIEYHTKEKDDKIIGEVIIDFVKNTIIPAISE